jgi:hypothetical protein
VLFVKFIPSSKGSVAGLHFPDGLFEIHAVRPFLRLGVMV